MRVRIAFKAKVLAHTSSGHLGEVLTFGEEDSANPIDISDPFTCLSFVEQEVRKRTRMRGIEDFEVVMNVLTSDKNGITTEDILVRPWRYPNSDNLFQIAQ